MKLICALLLVSALGAKPAFADDPPPGYEPQAVPKCSLVKAENGDEVCGYTLGEWKLVLKIDRELINKRRLLELEQQKTELLEDQKEGLYVQISSCTKNEGLLIERMNKLTQDLIDLDKKYQYERVKPRFGSPLAWTLAAVSTSVLAGVLVKDWID